MHLFYLCIVLYSSWVLRKALINTIILTSSNFGCRPDSRLETQECEYLGEFGGGGTESVCSHEGEKLVVALLQWSDEERRIQLFTEGSKKRFQVLSGTVWTASFALCLCAVRQWSGHCCSEQWWHHLHCDWLTQPHCNPSWWQSSIWLFCWSHLSANSKCCILQHKIWSI